MCIALTVVTRVDELDERHPPDPEIDGYRYGLTGVAGVDSAAGSARCFGFDEFDAATAFADAIGTGAPGAEALGTGDVAAAAEALVPGALATAVLAATGSAVSGAAGSAVSGAKLGAEWRNAFAP